MYAALNLLKNWVKLILQEKWTNHEQYEAISVILSLCNESFFFFWPGLTDGLQEMEYFSGRCFILRNICKFNRLPILCTCLLVVHFVLNFPNRTFTFNTCKLSHGRPQTATSSATLNISKVIFSVFLCIKSRFIMWPSKWILGLNGILVLLVDKHELKKFSNFWPSVFYSVY